MKFKKLAKGLYQYEGAKYNWEMSTMDDMKSFCIEGADKNNGSLIIQDGFYGLRLKDCKDIIYSWEQ